MAVDACAEPDLVDALKVSGFPEILFTNAGRIIHREKGRLYWVIIEYLTDLQTRFWSSVS